MPEITLSLSSHTALVLLALPAALVTVVWAYRHTTPSVSRLTRFALAGLRGCALALLILILGEPVLSLLSRSEKSPETVVLIDNSQSMGIRDSFEDRRLALQAVLSSPQLSELSSIGDVRVALFDRVTRAWDESLADSPPLDGDVTNIAEAIHLVARERQEHNTQAVVLLTDGVITEGGNPLYELDALGLPIYAVALGDSSARRDLRIRTVLANAVAYMDTKVPVAADIRSQGYASGRAEVLLRSEEGIVDQQVIDLAGGRERFDVTLSLTPHHPGMRRYTMELSAPGDDAVKENNRFSFYVKVLESKVTVLLLAGAPSADVAFIRRSLESDGTLTISSFIQHSDGTFAEGPLSAASVEKSDCLILVGYPTVRSDRETFGRVVAAVRQGKSVLSVWSRTTDLGLLKELEADLPASFSMISGAELASFVSVVPAERMHALLRTRGESDPADHWAALPPVVRRDVRIVPRPEAKVLLRALSGAGSASDPVYIARSLGSRKSLLFGAYGIWQWNMHRASEDIDPVADFLHAAVRWLSTREEEKPLRVNPVKEVFSGQEPVELVAQLYDATLQPVDDADVRVQVTGGGRESEVLAEPLGSGRYIARFEDLETSTYTYTARASADEVTLGTDQGSFSVGDLTVEFQDIRPNRGLLEQLAVRSGGQLFTATTLDGLPEAIQANPRFQRSVSVQADKVELWNDPWILGLLVLFLALEWVLRKRSGML